MTERLTKQQAKELVYAHEVDQVMSNFEEASLLKEHNQQLYDAYVTLLQIAEIDYQEPSWM